MANRLPLLSPAFSPEASFALCEIWVFSLNTFLYKSKVIFKADSPLLVTEKKIFPSSLGLTEVTGGYAYLKFAYC